MTQLDDRLGAALTGLVDGPDFVPDLAAIERRGRRMKARTVLTRGGVSLGVVAVAAAGVGLAGGGTKPAPQVAGPATSLEAPLAKLADSVLAGDTHLTGNATQVIRTQPGQVIADLYADDGLYFTGAADGSTRQVKASDNLANGVFGREVAIAERAAAGGDLTTASRDMAVAALDPGAAYTLEPGPVALPSGLTNAAKKALATRPQSGPIRVNEPNSVWVNSLDALVAGAGRPQVRAGVLRLLSTLPGISVTDTGSTVTVSADSAAITAGDRESLVLRASDGVPVRYTDGTVTVSYRVSRIDLAIS